MPMAEATTAVGEFVVAVEALKAVAVARVAEGTLRTGAAALLPVVEVETWLQGVEARLNPPEHSPEIN